MSKITHSKHLRRYRRKHYCRCCQHDLHLQWLDYREKRSAPIDTDAVKGAAKFDPSTPRVDESGRVWA